MKENIRLKILINVSLLIFILPFLQTCSDESLKKSLFYDLETEMTLIEEDTIKLKSKSIEVSKNENHKKIVEDKNAKEDWLKEIRKEYTYNAYF
ncbi:MULTISPECIES: hypothetical protein [Flavobacterium]|uniref:Lipoprotein n=1 Tax=Flavobacterium jumunjinense TaxID=998845 RepID=A0ABV5GKQ2_9FLAO|nr:MULTISPECIES: hypothetical protein [Flavobacterium]